MQSAPQVRLNRTATPEEAAAIAAAIQCFSAETAPAPPAEPAGMDPWLRAALEDGVSSAISFGPANPFGT